MPKPCEQCNGWGYIGTLCDECEGKPEEWEGLDGSGCATCGGGGWVEVDCPGCAGNGGADY